MNLLLLLGSLLLHKTERLLLPRGHLCEHLGLDLGEHLVVLKVAQTASLLHHLLGIALLLVLLVAPLLLLLLPDLYNLLLLMILTVGGRSSEREHGSLGLHCFSFLLLPSLQSRHPRCLHLLLRMLLLPHSLHHHLPR